MLAPVGSETRFQVSASELRLVVQPGDRVLALPRYASELRTARIVKVVKLDGVAFERCVHAHERE